MNTVECSTQPVIPVSIPQESDPNYNLLSYRKFDLFGIGISRIDYQEATNLLINAAQERRSMIVDHMPVHGLIEASSDPALKDKINQFDIVAPDGQPVRWALNRLHQTNLSDRVYGPELMLRLCRQAEQKRNRGVSLWKPTGSLGKIKTKAPSPVSFTAHRRIRGPSLSSPHTRGRSGHRRPNQSEWRRTYFFRSRVS